MEKLIIESIINLTRQKNVDSLDTCLLESLANLTLANSILLYALNYEESNDKNCDITRLLKLSLTEDSQFLINKELKKVTIDEHITACINKQSIVQDKLNNGNIRLLVPIKQEYTITRILDFQLNHDYPGSDQYVNNIIEIYNNLLLTLIDSETDKLTKLFNKWTFNNKLNELLEKQREKQENYYSLFKNTEKRSVKEKSSSWLAIFDIDNFKKINDTYGHLFGDEVILIIAQKMKRFFRNTDLLFRFGGEEFLIVLEPVPKDMAHYTFNRFCENIANNKFPQIETVTISVGYTKISDECHSHIIFECADKALYYAKEHGKNCVHNYEELIDKKLIIESKNIEPTVLFD